MRGGGKGRSHGVTLVADTSRVGPPPSNGIGRPSQFVDEFVGGKYYEYEDYSLTWGSTGTVKGNPAPSGGEEGGCPIGDLFRLLGKPHVLSILQEFSTSPRPLRFIDLQGRIRISPNTLSDRLKDLVTAGLLTRTAYNEIPPRVDYEITAKARELSTIFSFLADWASRHDLRPVANPSPPVVHSRESPRGAEGI
jgi:DNA-binding HxlR family transcriptional regulator